MTREERFWARVKKQTDGCWLWQGAVSPKGYGLFGHRKLKAHRLAYELAVGRIPEGLCVCHRCDNPACVRPDHLFVGTIADNNVDRSRKGRTRTGVGERNGRAKLTPETVKAIRSQIGTAPQREIADMFGVSEACVSRLKKANRWRHVA